MSLNKFVDTGVDKLTVENMNKSIARETDLQKAMNKAGLVQKEVQVTGKNGQTFTRKQWVKASEEQKSGDKGEHAKENISPRCKRNLDRALQNRDSFVDVKSEYQESINKLRKELKTTGTSNLRKQTITQDIETLNKELEYIIKKVEEDDASDSKANKSDKITVSSLTGKSYQEVVKILDDAPVGTVITGIIDPGSQKRFNHNDDVKIEKKSGYVANYAVGAKKMETWWEFNGEKKSDAAGTIKDALQGKSKYYQARNNSSKTESTESKHEKYKPSDFLFKHGGEKTVSLMNNLDRVFGVENFKNGALGHGTAKLKNGESVNFGMTDDGLTVSVTYNGYVYSGDPKAVAEDLYAKMYNKKYELKDDVNKKSEKIQNTTKNQPKIDHNTGVAKPEKKTMVQDYFSGNHGHSNGKSALAALLGKGYSKDDIMREAESQGVSWKKNDHAGINWMRASMAIQKHLGSNNTQSQNSNTKNR